MCDSVSCFKSWNALPPVYPAGSVVRRSITSCPVQQLSFHVLRHDPFETYRCSPQTEAAEPLGTLAQKHDLQCKSILRAQSSQELPNPHEFHAIMQALVKLTLETIRYEFLDILEDDLMRDNPWAMKRNAIEMLLKVC